MAQDTPRQSSRRRHGRARKAQTPPPSRAGRPPNPAEVRRSRRRALLVLGGLFAAECAIALLTSPVFAVRRAEVRGVAGLMPGEAAAVQAAASIAPGTNWLRCSPAGTEKRLRLLPCVESVEVRRTLPNGVSARVTARRPEALVKVGTALYEATREGVLIRAARPGVSFPLIVLRRARPARPGQALEDSAFDAALAVYDAFREEARARPAKIEVDPADNLCLNMRDGVRIQIGMADDLEAKLEQVRRVYRGEPDIARRVTAINLTCPSEPACTPRAPAPPEETNAPAQGRPGQPGTAPARPARPGATG